MLIKVAIYFLRHYPSGFDDIELDFRLMQGAKWHRMDREAVFRMRPDLSAGSYANAEIVGVTYISRVCMTPRGTVRLSRLLIGKLDHVLSQA